MRIESAVISHEGKIRANNEDNYFLNGSLKRNVLENRRRESMEETGKKYVFSVCDGMGGEKYGEIASLCSVKAMDVFQKNEWSKQTLEEFLETARSGIREKINGKNSEESGTAVVLLVLEKDTAYIANIGDSRIYLFRDEKLQQLSKDHTQARLMVDHGMLRAEEAVNHKSRHILTRYLGIDTEVLPEDFYIPPSLELSQGDLFLLCSDGLTDMVAEKEIEQCMKKYRKAGTLRMAEALCRCALQSGGKDNITCLIVSVRELDRKQPFFERVAGISKGIMKKTYGKCREKNRNGKSIS